MDLKVGDKVEFIWLGELTQGVVTEIRATNHAISYQIEYFGDERKIWFTERELLSPTPVSKVPQFVADWLNHCKQREYDLACLLDYGNAGIPDEMYEWLISSADNQELLARAWFDGYEVEKEPVWVVENENGYRLRSITMNPGNSLNWSFDSKNKNYIEFEEFETAKKAAYLVTGNVTEI
ncbi:TPA: DUF1642 domain-containing protein [Listeria monocytogenes]|uniref:DUF1642 domain-containing protein n=1 Tax=Listeria monocytogenes TaxID=1639 RepID=A0AAD2M9L9_LISMN|nr:DUF1642 domain-containing protein [Listeria monocytogenes]ECC2297668.1 DUF1642 domain-containing protein [Listeria monocytogenes]ECC2420313.1 DUF1642 domain-containing protein [Listeria monocytogenes]ECR7122808.1 DUF1642 domain-containing protein [Listeria monocytogenes]EDO0771421.1 DUF1642 domain-containing protein [Listeria monocytogenes]